MVKTSMTKVYVKAVERSFFLQKQEEIIPSDGLNEIVELLSPIGLQPLGIASKPVDGTNADVVLADYFFPAFVLIRTNRDDVGLHLKAVWVRNVQYRGQEIRLFPDIFKRGGANRCGTVNFGPNGILVSRYDDRQFFSFSPLPDGKWKVKRDISLPPVSDTEGQVHSALLTGNRLYTIESLWTLREWNLNKYRIKNGTVDRIDDPMPLPDWRYGIGQRPSDDSLWFVTDFRSSAKPGIYRGKELVVPNVFGNGICFLPDGSALVSRYGLGHPSPLGVAGALIYVPSRLFK